MQLVLYAQELCFLKKKIEGAASIVGDRLCRKEVNEFIRDTTAFSRFPALGTPSGFIPGSNAALRFIGNAHPAAELYGRSIGERAAVDSTLDALSAELETPIVAFALNKADKNMVVTDVLKALGACDAVLAKQTYLVGERLSLADLALAGAIYGCLEKKVLTQEDMQKFLHVVRLYLTIRGRCWPSEGVEIQVDTGAISSPTVGKKGKKEDAKKEEPKQKKDKPVTPPAAAPAPPAPKPKDPIEELPVTDFDMEAWKRYYSNSKDLRGDAMPYLWEKLDKAGWSFWHMEYLRYTPDDNTKVFMASNLLGMFLQRIDNWLRKYMFAVCDVLEEDGYFGVEGIFLWRGQDVPQRLVENDQYESFKWTKLSLEADKERITDYFCEEDELGGKKICDCKVYK
eukprot:Gregarina_sp_Poly_1__5285@NODE_279_length_10190_cov_93_504495_g243_i0_p3_GENE_NODE_279_length_10190_cov_93_504495_g243_i0NODE_279_length_10190_cov_93_504495_g243_i0_p3_ORF_typecomplete_len398_score61_05EF1G/PF00647_19/5_9e33GST_C/PF00043_25/1_7e08GST_C/PF00043_25/1e04GST_C_3/PF14497_6/2_8e07GST_C_3/PF14497_6/3_7e03GST_C_2/PF13410_6/4_5e06GST_C_2/PF13410_6/5_1e03GST_C_5/PF16865_5/0_11GST_C_6/PF17171_4/0_17Hormone_3/PF00159_18/9Hormone_3/PF00159_18/1_2e04_NODE_279_length_10190_cov_93_504495_g243_i